MRNKVSGMVGRKQRYKVDVIKQKPCSFEFDSETSICYDTLYLTTENIENNDKVARHLWRENCVM